MTDAQPLAQAKVIMSRVDTFPRYEIHLLVGVRVVFITKECAVQLSPLGNFPSVGAAITAVNRHAKRNVEYQFDRGTAWSPA